MSDLVLNVLAAFAEFERELIGERLRDARAALRSRGIRNAGRIPFGYSSDPLSRQLVLVPDEASVVKRMFEMAGAGAPPSGIAAWINDRAESNQRVMDGRQPWSPKAVLRVLDNRVYLGRMGAVADAHDAIVDEPLFAKARAAVDGRRTRAPGRRRPGDGDLYLLRRQLRCVHCDRLMRTSYPSCSTRRRPPRPGDMVRLDDLAEGKRGAAPLLNEVRKFHEASLRGEYYDSFAVNSKNFAAAAIYAVGSVNFLFDRTQRPHLTGDAEQGSLPDGEVKIIEEAIAEAYRCWSDAQRRSIWGGSARAGRSATRRRGRSSG